MRVKSCRVCDHAAKEGQIAREHDCRKNWEGSAKAMEPSMVVEMVRKANETVSIGTLVGDDDTTTIARVRADLDESIEKCRDKNHVRKSLANELYKVRDRHKNKLSVKTISYLQKCFTYAVDQNRGDSAGLRKSLETIIPHTLTTTNHVLTMMYPGVDIFRRLTVTDTNRYHMAEDYLTQGFV